MADEERMDRARMMEEMLRDHYEEKSEKEKREREAQQDKEKETTANGHVRGIKEEITLDED